MRPLLAAATLALSCVHARAEPVIVASTTIVGDIVKTVAGPDLRVEMLFPPGSDPHVFEPRPGDLRTLAAADLLFLNGADLEASLDHALESIREDGGPRVVELSQGLPLRSGHGICTSHEHGEHHHGDHDPHVWFDPTLVARWTERIAAELSALLPERSAAFAERAAALRAELAELDAWIARRMASIPEARRVVVTDHDELGYFADRYGLRVAGSLIDTVTTAAEASARNIADLEDRMRRDGVRILVTGTGAYPALAERVAADTGARIVRLHTASLGPAGSDTDRYIGMMRANVETLAAALEGGAP